MLDSDSVWARRETKDAIISDQLYNAAIGAVLMWGFALNYVMVTSIPVEAVLAIPGWLFLVGYFACAITGTIIFTRSDNPVVSFLGYNLVVLPIGIVLVPFVNSFDPNIISEAVMITGLVTAMMMVSSMLFPKLFLSIGNALFLSLLFMIIAEIGMMFFMGHNPEVFDWIIAVIFCGYIGYDWARANAIPKTLDNAVDSAASLYLDIINLFIRILSILGRRD